MTIKSNIEYEYKVPFWEPELKQHHTLVVPWGDKRYVIDSDDKVLLVGRVDIQGNADTGFNTTGFSSAYLDKLERDVENPPLAAGLIVQSDGGVIGGLQTPLGLGLVRFTESGALDTNFGTDGTLVHPIALQPAPAQASASDDRLIHTEGLAVAALTTMAVGKEGVFYAMAGRRFGNRFTLLRCLPNGQLDTTFNKSGKVSVQHPDFPTDALAVVAAPDGGAVVAGTLGNGIGSMRGFFSRFNVDGSVDMQFGKGGYAIFDSNSTGIPAERLYQMELTSMTRLADGGYAASGYIVARAPWQYYGLLIRIDALGEPVDSFNAGKPVLFEHPGGGEASFLFGGVAEQKDGKLVVAGGLAIRSTDYENHMLVVRYMPDGTLDARWGENGWATYQPLGYSVNYLQCAVLDEEQRILISGDGGPDNFLDKMTGFVVQLSD